MTAFTVIISTPCNDCSRLLRAELDEAHLIERMRLVCVRCFEKRESGTQDYRLMQNTKPKGHAPQLSSRLVTRPADHTWVTPRPNDQPH